MIKPSGPCVHCGKREATAVWVGDGDVVAYVHGMFEFWCELCVVEAQLEHARKMAATIPELEAKLAVLSGKPTEETT